MKRPAGNTVRDKPARHSNRALKIIEYAALRRFFKERLVRRKAREESSSARKRTCFTPNIGRSGEATEVGLPPAEAAVTTTMINIGTGIS